MGHREEKPSAKEEDCFLNLNIYFIVNASDRKELKREKMNETTFGFCGACSNEDRSKGINIESKWIQGKYVTFVLSYKTENHLAVYIEYTPDLCV